MAIQDIIRIKKYMVNQYKFGHGLQNEVHIYNVIIICFGKNVIIYHKRIDKVIVSRVGAPVHQFEINLYITGV